MSPSVASNVPSASSTSNIGPVVVTATATGSGGGAGGNIGTGGTPALGGSPALGGAGSGVGGVPPSGSAGAPATGTDETVEIYDPLLMPRFDLDLLPDAVEALRSITTSDNPDQDTYVAATFTYDKEGKNEVVTNIGVRIKGEGSFQTFDQKPALKLKFDEFVDAQRFRGLARMTLNNLYDDASFLAERLAYDVYRAAGVPAPRCNSARIYINGEFYGVYTNIEAEDKHFLQRWFGSNDGNLYEKDGFSDLSIDAESEFQLETNETLGDRSDLLALLNAVDAATNPDTFLGELAAVVDIEEFLKFTAVEAAVNQWDMHAFTVYYVHNFRLYSDPDSGLFSWIPWGHDLSMKPFRVDVKDYVPLFELATQGADTERVTAGVVFQRCIESAPCKAALVEAVEQTITVWEGLDMEATATRYYEQIRPLVMQDPRKRTFDGDLTLEAFDAAHTVLQRTLSGRVAALRADLAAQ